MENIKFRAYDDRSMIYSHNNDLNESTMQLSWFFNKVRTDAHIMQFTGLTDKNGKEIYKGDYLSIVANKFGQITNKNGEKVKYEVRHEECDYILFRTDIELIWGKLSRISEMCWSCEVIGNIYETKL